MAGWSMQEMSPWKPRALTIPPNSVYAWFRLAVWELWMGMFVGVILGFGSFLIVTSPNRLITVTDLSNCNASPADPCVRVAYQFGALNVVFSALCGAMLIGLAAWLLWELWSAFEPKPITDDFLRLLNESFGRRWSNPLTWPWARVLWAYGFTVVGATMAAGVGMIMWTLVARSESARAPTVGIQTSESFRLGQ